MVELLAEGRNAQVYAYGAGRVLKLDRPEWTGLSPFEAEMLVLLSDAGLPVPRSHGAVTVEGRSGVVLDRVDGAPLEDLVATSSAGQLDALAEQFLALQAQINAATVPGLPALVPRLAREVESTATNPAARAERLDLLHELDDGSHGVCHFDFHPGNVLVGPGGWVVIDWLTVAAGPAAADLARTLVLRGRQRTGAQATFMQAVRRRATGGRGIDGEVLDAWVRVVAAGRLGEGFDGEEAAWLARVADGEFRLCA